MIKWFSDLFYNWGNGPARTAETVQKVTSSMKTTGWTIAVILAIVAGAGLIGYVIKRLTSNSRKEQALVKSLEAMTEKLKALEEKIK